MLIFALAPACMIAQEFEAVSIKPHKEASNSSSMHSDRSVLTGTNQSLRRLIMTAYGIRDYQVEGPSWLETERFDIVARLPEALPKGGEAYRTAFAAMILHMLEDRFHLRAHPEQKPLTVYGLTVAKSGIKFAQVPNTGSESESQNGVYVAKCVDMATLAGFLSGRTDLPVLDMTGLKGTYALKFSWSTEAAKADEPEQALREALQDQLGLKLETRKAPVPMVVVDSIDRTPTEN